MEPGLNQRLLPNWQPDFKVYLTGTASPTVSVCWNILINATLDVSVQSKRDLLADLFLINPSLGEIRSRDGRFQRDKGKKKKKSRSKTAFEPSPLTEGI